MEPTQATVDNPIICWMHTQREWVQVTWTPPGENWPRKRIEKSGLPTFMLKHYDNPDEHLKHRFRTYYDTIQLERLFLDTDDPFIEMYNARICFLKAWFKIYDA